MSQQIDRDRLGKMRAYAKRRFDYHLPGNETWVAVERALRETEEQYGTYDTAQTHGVEGFAEYGGCTYLNTGDGYTPTVYFRKGRFYVGCWADIVEANS